MEKKLKTLGAFFKNEEIPFSVFNEKSGDDYEGWKHTYTGKNWTIREVEISYLDADEYAEMVADQETHVMGHRG